MRKAITTLIYDGDELFKIWYRYYTKFFAEEDIYVLSFQAPPHIFENLKCNVIDIPHSIFRAGRGPITYKDAIAAVAKANEFQSRLFHEGYQCVVHADLDEIIFYPEGLDTLIEKQPAKFITTTGYEIVQNREKEDPLDFSKPVLDQRSYWYRWDAYDKPLVMWAHANRIPGFHAVEKCRGKKNIWPNLYLLHLHKVDEKLTKKMHIAHNSHVTNGLIDEGFDLWWRNAEDHLTLIPDIVKKSGII